MLQLRRTSMRSPFLRNLKTRSSVSGMLVVSAFNRGSFFTRKKPEISKGDGQAHGRKSRMIPPSRAAHQRTVIVLECRVLGVGRAGKGLQLHDSVASEHEKRGRRAQ